MKCCEASAVLIRDPRKRVGGFETWVETLAQSLPSAGIEALVLVPGDEHETDAIRLRLTAAEVIRIDASEETVGQARHVVNGLEALARTGHRGVFFTMGYPYVNVAGANLRGGPWVSVPVMHGRSALNHDWMCVGPPRKIVVPDADFASDCRQALARRIGRIRTLGKIAMIPHGVPLPPKEAVRDKMSRSLGNTLRLIAVSRLHPEAKRPWDYMRIAETLACQGLPFALRILGDGPCLEPMRTHVVEHGLKECVQLVGAADRESVYRELLDADVMLAASETEAFGLSVAEALACGCAVVSSDLPGAIAQMVINDTTGYRVPTGNIEAYADRIVKLARHEKMIRRMGLAGYALVSRQFSDVAMGKAYARLIRTVAPRRPMPDWTQPTRLAVSPGEAVGPGLARRLRNACRLQRFRGPVSLVGPGRHQA